MKNKILFISLFYFFHITNNYGQNLELNYLDSGRIAIQNNLFEDAFSYYIKAFSYGIPENPNRIYEAAVLSTRTGNVDLGFFLLQLSIDKGFSSLDHIRNNKDFPPLCDSRFDNCMLKIEKRDSTLHLISLRLDSIYERDQNIRLAYRQLLNKNDIDESVKEEWLKQITLSDSTNMRIIEDIISKNGFWGNSLKTPTSQLTMWLVIQHASYDVRKKYTPLIEKAVEREELSLSMLAYIFDRNEMEESGRQKYGTQYEIKGDKIFFNNLLDPDRTDEFRASMGLPPLNEYIQQIKESHGLK